MPPPRSPLTPAPNSSCCVCALTLQLLSKNLGNFDEYLLDPLLQPRTCEHAAFLLNRRLCSEPKLRVNARVVVVGASDAAVSFIQSLVMVRGSLLRGLDRRAGGLLAPRQ